MKISIFQFDISWLDPQKNILTIEAHLKSIDQDVNLLVLPEMFLTGFCMKPEHSSIKEKGEEFDALLNLADKYSVAMIGSLAIEEGGKFYNRVLFLTKEGVLGRYDKQYLYSPSGEDEVFSVKYETQLFKYQGWTILPQVCYDLRFSENVRQVLAPDILIYVANWPKPRIAHWNALLKARAIENQCYVIGCNREGIDGNEWEYPGGSQVILPDGTTLDLGAVDGLKIANLSHEVVDEYRSKYRFLEDKKTVVIK